MNFVSADTITETCKFERTTEKLNIGESLKDVFVTSIDDDDFSNFLQDSSVGSYDYRQKITIGNLVLQNFSDADYNDGEYTIGLHIIADTKVLDYTLDFIAFPSLTFLEQQQILFLGKYYTITGADSSLNQLTLEDGEGNILILRSGNEIKFNGNYVDGLDVLLMYDSSSNLNRIILSWISDDEEFVAVGTNLDIPVLESLSLRFERYSYNEEYAQYCGNMFLDAFYEEYVACTEDWDCTSWSECVNDEQTRTCTDLNDCGTIENKPIILRDCETQEQEENTTTTTNDDVDDTTIDDTITTNNTTTQQQEQNQEQETSGAKLYIQNKEVSIKRISGGENTIKIGSDSIKTFLEVVEKSEKIYIKTSEGDKEIKILPSEAKSNANKIDVINNIEIEEEKGNAVYVISGTKKARLFFVFPLTAEVEQGIDIEEGSVVSTNKPWWHFLAFGI